MTAVAPLDRRQRWLLAALLLTGALLRIAVNDVVLYSPADERHYTELTQTLVERGFFAGYPTIVDTQVRDAANHVLPPPLRWGYLALTTLGAHLRGASDPRGLAWLSTLAGILALPLAFAVGRRFVGVRAALLGTALCVVSPLQLAMGRRAMSDELFCAAALLALWTTLRALEPSPHARRRLVAALASWTFLLAVKETALLLEPALLILILLQRRIRDERPRLSDIALLIVPPIVYIAIFCFLARGIHPLWALLQTHATNMGGGNDDYSAAYQSGPPHRLLIDLFTIAPIICLLAVASWTWMLDSTDRSARLLGVLTLAVVAAFCLAPAKNLRFIIAADPLLRLVAAWPLATRARPRLAIAVVALDAAIELTLFATIFLVANVYDPITYNLMTALHILPQ